MSLVPCLFRDIKSECLISLMIKLPVFSMVLEISFFLFDDQFDQNLPDLPLVFLFFG